MHQNKIKTIACALREILCDVVEQGLAPPVDLLVLLGEGLLRVQRPGHHILLSSRSHHCASAAWRTAALPYVALGSINHIRLGRGSCPAFEHYLSKSINSKQQRSRPLRIQAARINQVGTCTVLGVRIVRLHLSPRHRLTPERRVLNFNTEMSQLPDFPKTNPHV